MKTMNSNEKRCVCGVVFNGSSGRTVCIDCHVTQHNREPGTPQAEAVAVDHGPANRLRPCEGGREVYRRTYGVRLAEGFAMFGGAEQW